MPKVSVIIPIYGVEKFIERCAHSLFQQTYEDIEYIFVNDCSHDKSVDILKNVICNYPNRNNLIRIIHHKQNRGLSAARNTGIANATGEFVIHVDSDDYLELNAVENLVKKQKDTQADIVTGQAIQHTTKNWSIMERPQFANKFDFVNDIIEPTIHHTIWGRLIRRSLYTDNKVYAKEGINIGEDLQVMAQLAYYANKFVSISDIVYHYDTTNVDSYMNSLSPQKYIIRLEQDKESFSIVYNFFNKKDLTYIPKITKYLKYYLIKLLKEYCIGNNIHKFVLTKKELKRLNINLSFREKLLYSNFYISKFLLTIKYSLNV